MPAYLRASYGAPSGAPQVPQKRQGPLIAAVVGGVLAIVGGIVAAVLLTKQGDGKSASGLVPDVGTKLESAAEACGITGVIGDGGHTMTLSGVAAEEDPGPVSYTEYDCVLTELDTPQSVLSHLGQTRALDGMQTNQWEEFEALWTYHPDHGVNITITEK